MSEQIEKLMDLLNQEVKKLERTVERLENKIIETRDELETKRQALRELAGGKTE